MPANVLAGWLAVAMSAPFVYLAGRQNWLALLTVAAICAAALWVVLTRPVERLLSHSIFCLLEFVFLAVACTVTAKWSARIWPTGQGYPAVPLTLLALATASAFYGVNRTAKGVGVLFWVSTILYSILLAFGSRNIKVQYLQPVWEIPAPVTWFVLLLPCAAQFLPRERAEKGKHILPLICFLAVGFGLWTEGNLSSNVAKVSAWPFYEAGESIHLFGIANRIEPFISVAATVGYYGLFSLLISAGGCLAENIRSGWGKWGAVTMGALSALGLLLEAEMPWFVLAVSAFVLWVALPVLGSLFPEKKSKKEQNNA